jgi:hypothetical protein
MRTVTAFIVLFVSSTCLTFADPPVVREASGLRLIAYRHYMTPSPATPTETQSQTDGQTVLERQSFCREIVALVENCGTNPITIPTYPKGGKAEGFLAHNVFRITSYDFRKEECEGREVLLSSVKFQPVTLAPGQTTELEAQTDCRTWILALGRDTPADKRWRNIYEDGIKHMKDDSQIHDYVEFDVSKETADHYGWWSGHLCVPVTDRSFGPNQSTEATPSACTPAACAPVAPRSVAAHL